MQKTILITRPKDFAKPLTEALLSIGINSVCLELIEIQPKKFALETLRELLQYYLLIFISRNAVEYSFGIVKNNPQELQNLATIFQAKIKAQPKINVPPASNAPLGGTNAPPYTNAPLIATVGSSSALALATYGTKNVIYPRAQIYNSEALWQEIKHLPLANKKVAIIRGDAGRDFLSAHIKESGAILDEISVYSRTIPQDLHNNCKNIFEQHQIDIILITCKSSLDNLVELARNLFNDSKPPSARINIFNKILLVVSSRLYEEAKLLGFKNIITALNATDAAIVTSLRENASSFANDTP